MANEDTRIYILRDGSEKTWRIRATSYSVGSEDKAFAKLHFRGVDGASGIFVVSQPYQLFAEGMLLSSLEDNLVFPAIPETPDGEIDPFTEALFSEAEKIPFTPQERQILHSVLDRAKEKIHQEFQTSEAQQADIENKLDYLKRKVDELDKFNWKRLFITALVGVAVDLGFGTSIPSALLGVFKEVLSQLVDRFAKMLLPPSKTT